MPGADERVTPVYVVMVAPECAPVAQAGGLGVFGLSRELEIRGHAVEIILPRYRCMRDEIWQRMEPGDGPSRLAAVIEELRGEDHCFHVDGGSWTNNISWVCGYDNVLVPMEGASSLFHDRVIARGVRPDKPGYRAALFHLLSVETSCYRYWGQGVWTEYGEELSRHAIESIERIR